MARRNGLEEERGLTSVGLGRLLEWLDDGVDSNGESYLELRRRLVTYFDRRNRRNADELADETFNRIGRTLADGETIATTPPARYCYVVARFVLLEDFRRDVKQIQLDESRGTSSSVIRMLSLVGRDEEAEHREHRLGCLDRCLGTLTAERRDLAIDYYRDARREKIDRRRQIAERLGISMNALAIRASRIRDALERCVRTCCSEP